MRIDQLNFGHLFYFWRVARLGHLTRAAEEVHTSQSSVWNFHRHDRLVA